MTTEPSNLALRSPCGHRSCADERTALARAVRGGARLAVALERELLNALCECEPRPRDPGIAPHPRGCPFRDALERAAGSSAGEVRAAWALGEPERAGRLVSFPEGQQAFRSPAIGHPLGGGGAGADPLVGSEGKS